MEKKSVEWLPHLPEEVMEDARGPEFDAYVVALEGWRRGLTLKWHAKNSEKFSEMKTWHVDKPGKLFSLSSKGTTHYFFRTRGDKVTNEAVEIGSDKEKTKEYLQKAGINTPEGKRFKEDASDEEILNYAETIGYPVVIKPTDGSFGRGVVTDLGSKEELEKALYYVRHKSQYNDIIVERHVSGEDYRLYVVGDRTVGAIKRIPANITGDGTHTINELIEIKNQKRKENPRLISCPILVNTELKEYINKQGYSPDSILEEGKLLYLTNKNNISIGGDPIAAFEELPEEVKRTAVKALHAMPGLMHGAVDILFDRKSSMDSSIVILELNPTAQIGSLLFPLEGKASDIPSEIIDFYFPETKDVRSDKEKIYFDLTDVLYPLITRTATSSTVTPAPLGAIYSKKYTVKGDVQGIDFHRGLRKQAFERDLNGLVLNLYNGDIEVVVAGTDQEMVNDFRNALWEDPERSEVTEVLESEWNHPIKVGFEVKADLKTQLEQLKNLKQGLEIAENQFKQVEKQNKKYKSSSSWKITWPIRFIGEVLKKIKVRSG
ncbi:acylphosphatase [Evansella clarkii]|uniref:acylphosphatase n=1 Tax=Evansella clarkii TaxID=79879 RepID=UPI000B44E073|nr:acylphosphatase [Evansella clarkii]